MQLDPQVFKDRFKEAITPEAMRPWCEMHGISYSTLTGAWNRNSIPNVELLAQISIKTRKSIEWLIGLSNDGAETAVPAVSEVDAGWSDFVQIPIYDVHASAGHGSFAPGREQVSKYLAFRHDFLSKELRITKNGLYCVRVRGISMEPILRDGHPALIDPNDTEVLTEGPHFLRLEGALLLKNLQRLPGGRLRIWSENQTTNAFAPIEVDWPAREGVDLQIFGRIRWSDHTF